MREPKPKPDPAPPRVVPLRDTLSPADLRAILARFQDAIDAGWLEVERRSDAVVALVDWRRGRETLIGVDAGTYWLSAPDAPMIDGTLPHVLRTYRGDG